MNYRKEISLPSKKMSYFFIWCSIFVVIIIIDLGWIGVFMVLPISLWFLLLSRMHQVTIDDNFIYLSSIYHKDETIPINELISFEKKKYLFVNVYKLNFLAAKSYEFLPIPKILYSYKFELDLFLKELIHKHFNF
jgi:hypothetical protein